MTRNYLLCLLFSFVGLYAAEDVPFTLSENDLICYNNLKEAVLEKFEADIPGFCKICLGNYFKNQQKKRL